MRYSGTILCVVGAFFLAGCANLDPWGVMSKAPPSRGQPFEGRIVEGEEDAVATSRSDDDIAGRTLCLAECIRTALERNPQTAGSWQAARAAAARVGQAKAEYLPIIGFTSSAARGDSAELDSKVDPGVQNRYDAVFGVRYLLFDGGGREARVKGAAAELLAANFRHNTVLQNLALSVEEAYYNLLAVRSFRDLAVETVNQRGYQLRLAEARYRTGLVARSDVLKAQTGKADADLALVRARNAVHVARGRLAGTMGLRVSIPFDIAKLPEGVFRQELADIESLLEEAARNRPELQTALALVRLQRSAVKVAESRFWPAVALDTGFGWLGRSLLPSQKQWSVGLAVDLPLFTGFDRTYQLQRTSAGLAGAVADRRSLLRGIELEVWTAYWRVIESSQAIEAAGKLVTSAEESARVAEGEYKNGTGSIIGLIDAQTARSAARARLIGARLDRRTAMARFDRAVGRSLAEPRESTSKESEQP